MGVRDIGVGNARGDSEDGHGGFTLIELLVVVIVIGILAAIAIPTYLSQRERAWDGAAQSDLRVVLVFMEVYNADTGQYSEDALTAPSTNFSPSNGVVVDTTNVTASDYCVSASHTNSSNSWVITSTAPIVTSGTCP